MRLLVFIPFMFVQLLFNPFGLADNSPRDFSNQHLVFKKYESQNSLPVFLFEEEVVDLNDGEQKNIKQNRQDSGLFLQNSGTSYLNNAIGPLLSRNRRFFHLSHSSRKLFRIYRNLRLKKI